SGFALHAVVARTAGIRRRRRRTRTAPVENCGAAVVLIGRRVAGCIIARIVISVIRCRVNPSPRQWCVAWMMMKVRVDMGILGGNTAEAAGRVSRNEAAWPE